MNGIDGGMTEGVRFILVRKGTLQGVVGERYDLLGKFGAKKKPSS